MKTAKEKISRIQNYLSKVPQQSHHVNHETETRIMKQTLSQLSKTSAMMHRPANCYDCCECNQLDQSEDRSIAHTYTTKELRRAYGLPTKKSIKFSSHSNVYYFIDESQRIKDALYDEAKQALQKELSNQLPLYKIDILIEKQMKAIMMKNKRFKCEHQISTLQTQIDNLHIHKANINCDIKNLYQKECGMKLHQMVLNDAKMNENKSILKKENDENQNTANLMTYEDNREFERKWDCIDEYKERVEGEYQNAIATRSDEGYAQILHK